MHLVEKDMHAGCTSNTNWYNILFLENKYRNEIIDDVDKIKPYILLQFFKSSNYVKYMI